MNVAITVDTAGALLLQQFCGVGRIVTGPATLSKVSLDVSEKSTVATVGRLPLQHTQKKGLQRLPTLSRVLSQCVLDLVRYFSNRQHRHDFILLAY